MKRPLRCENLDRFQHYKNRKPPWIKLYRDLLDDSAFQLMSAEARALLPMLWLLCSEHDDGLVDGDSTALAWRLRCASKPLASAVDEIIEAGFFSEVEAVAPRYHDASTMLADRKHDAIAERETEGEKRKRQIAPREPPMIERVREVYGHWHSKHPRALPPEQIDSSSTQYRTIKARLKQYTVDQLKLAIDGNHADEWCAKNGYNGWDTCLRANKIDRYIEIALQHTDRQKQSSKHPADILEDLAAAHGVELPEVTTPLWRLDPKTAIDWLGTVENPGALTAKDLEDAAARLERSA